MKSVGHYFPENYETPRNALSEVTLMQQLNLEVERSWGIPSAQLRRLMLFKQWKARFGTIGHDRYEVSIDNNAIRKSSNSAFLYLTLAVALLVRLTYSLNTDVTPHPDAFMQYLEQGHRLAFGYGIVPWEYDYGVRSWIIPGSIALVLKIVAAFGLDRPDVYQPTLKIVFCAISIALPYSVYRIAQDTLSEGAARVALLGTSFWYQLIAFAGAPLADSISTYLVFGALAFLTQRASTPNAIISGVLFGLTFAVRIQLTPFIALALLFAAKKWGRQAVAVFLGFCATVLVAGAFDEYTWGRWFSSIFSNLELNLSPSVIAAFGTAPTYYYVPKLALFSGGLVFVGMLGLARSWRTTWPFSAMGLAYLLAISTVPHKEVRFLFPLIPIWWIGLAALSTEYGDRIQQTTDNLARNWRQICLLGLIIFGAISFICSISRIGVDESREVYRILARQKNVTGVIDQREGAPLVAGYYDLHQRVPIFHADLPESQIARALQSPTIFASHWLTTVGAAPPTGYKLLTKNHAFAIWERITSSPQVVWPNRYSTRFRPSFNEAAIPPKVSPRW